MNINRQFAGAASGARAPSRTLSDDFDCLPIAPLLAGARARGLAEAFEILGIAAILVAADGDVLFANSEAQALFGPHLNLVGEHLSTGDEVSQRALRRMMDAALKGAKRSGEMTLQRGGGLRALRLRATPVASAEADPFQLLKAVILIDQAAERVS
jgi:PAS domain-containing protein